MTAAAPPPAGLPARLRASAEVGPTVSFELYPPRSQTAAEKLWSTTLPALAEADPDFLSVTYGASGSSRDTSREVVRWVVEHSGVRPVAHLTCIGAPRDELREVARGFVADGVQDFLALRGDPPAGETTWRPHPDGLHRASELVELLLRTEPGLAVGVAATPSCLSGWSGDPTGCGDLLALRAKQDAGAQYAITQVFFEVESYTRYVAAARAAGVQVPLVPGLVPLEDPRRLRRLEEISGVPVPARVLEILDGETDETRRRAAGLAMGAELAEAVLEAGAPGLHLYTFNQSAASLALLDRLGLASGRLAAPAEHPAG
ncbi:methylenetetrahydrofolate reductase [Actinotalea sp. M2MS4P-6]|uniref:methylenetetrahydrofolate reductase n=1 Tax=Actinotalea sp. M2MS4P-6 TaxID=2983762 RepID=UPI0021E47F2A|nr:methylenetetrahydrofolate reductase [Actinotalea sp. M2MS4P-6]MCV2395994.1 methylenetetrahydrofolate reductase [Actinotalea sp. M2MS4P-6]